MRKIAAAALCLMLCGGACGLRRPGVLLEGGEHNAR